MGGGNNIDVISVRQWVYSIIIHACLFVNLAAFILSPKTSTCLTRQKALIRTYSSYRQDIDEAWQHDLIKITQNALIRTAQSILVSLSLEQFDSDLTEHIDNN